MTLMNISIKQWIGPCGIAALESERMTFDDRMVGLIRTALSPRNP